MLKRFSIKQIQLFSFSAILILLFIISVSSFISFNKMSDSLYTITEKEAEKVEITSELTEGMTRMRLDLANYILEESPENRERSEKTVNEDIKYIKSLIKQLKPLLTGSNKESLNQFQQHFNDYTDLIPLALERYSAQDQKGFEELSVAMTPIGESARVELAKVHDNIDKSMDKTIDTTSAQINFGKMMIMIVSAIATILSITVVIFTTRIIRRSVMGVVKNVDITTNSVTEIKSSIDKTATGAKELDQSMDLANGAVGELVASIQQVAGNTNEIAIGVDEMSAAMEQMSTSINLVAESADQLQGSTGETSSAIQEMMATIEQVAINVVNASSSAEEIAAAIEEMSSSIKSVSENAENLTGTAEQAAEKVDEMVVSIQQVADSAQTVNQLSNTVKHDAFEGTVSLNETLAGMQEISQVINRASGVMENLGKSSEEIGSIIEVIDEIADQTNLLALNAAIEAARAGEYGKGFAVVADEVRKLAERSAKATKEIADLIKGIQAETVVAINSINEGAQKVEIGNNLADKTNQAIMKISQGIAQVTEEMNQIAIATEEQTKNSEFLTKAIANVTSQASEMTYSTKEQSTTAEEIVRGIMSTKDQVLQISIATGEQARGSSAIISAVESVTSQSSAVMNATREQALTAHEIVNNIYKIKEMVSEMTIATNEQSTHGQGIAFEVEKVRKQTEELDTSIELQRKEIEEVAKAIIDVNQQVKAF